MIILTEAQSEIILGRSSLWAGRAELRPVPLSDGNFGLPETVLSDARHADVQSYLNTLPTRVVVVGDLAPAGPNWATRCWTPDGYRPSLQQYNGHWYGLQTPGKAYSHQVSGNVRRFEIRQGEIGSVYDPVGQRHRVEWYSADAVPTATSEMWWSQAVKVESASDFIVMGQFRAQEDLGDYLTSSPACSIQFYGGSKLVVTYTGTSEAVHTSQPAINLAYQVPFPIGVWIRMVLRIKFDPFGSGELQVWRDGIEAANLTGLTLGYNDARGPRFKFGAYCDDAGLAIASFANVEWGTSSLADRIINPLPI